MPRASGVKEKPKNPASLPTGAITFLFTDIEGSTQAWEAHPRAMQSAIKRHDTLMRAAIERHRGYVFKTVGDAFCAAFHSATDAVEAALEAQRSLAKENFSAIGGLRVRMGLHAGHAHERDADYFGPAVNRVARLMSIGHGGQTLVSNAVKELVQDELVKGISLTDLGSHRLKDLSLAEHVWQLAIAGMPSDFPPLASLDFKPNNLSIQVTSFRGREEDIKELERLLSSARLLTLVGAGGIGKTRLALQAGADLLDQFSDGVWFIELAPLADNALVAEVACQAVGVTARRDRPAIDAVVDHLRQKKSLLILDNCEHLIEPAAQLVNRLLRQCPDVRILATSRQPLGISGETIRRLPSLGVPEPTKSLNADEAMHYGAVALFVDRAQSADVRFQLTDDNVPVVTEICRHLDGIPLAIELAAARVKVLSIPHLAQRLTERFRLLTGGAREALPRQKTLRALIDWSHDLLSPQEQLLFRRLAIFSGNFSLDAATNVCGCNGIDKIDVLDLLTSLVDKSLVVAETASADERFRLLESTREYALEKLRESGELEHLTRAHAEYFLALGRSVDDAAGASSGRKLATTLEPDTDNFRAALDWALTKGNEIMMGSTLAGALDWLWYHGRLQSEGRRWLQTALQQLGTDASDDVSARLWLALAPLSDGQREYDAAKYALSLYEKLDDDRHASYALHNLGQALHQLGKFEESEQAHVRGVSLARKSGDKHSEAMNLMGLGYVLMLRGNIQEARRSEAEALQACEALGDEDARGIVLGNLAEMEFNQGNAEQAAIYGAEYLRIMLTGKNVLIQAIGYNNLAAYHISLRNLERARECAREGLRLAREVQSLLRTADAAQDLALVAALCGDISEAARLIGYVEKCYRDERSTREATEAWGHAQLMARLREQLNEDEITALIAEGAAWSEDLAVQEALKV